MERDCHSRVVPDKICYIEGNRYSCISNENETLIDGNDVYWCYENICDKYLDIKKTNFCKISTTSGTKTVSVVFAVLLSNLILSSI